jgi:hypothetical protein
VASALWVSSTAGKEIIGYTDSAGLTIAGRNPAFQCRADSNLQFAMADCQFQ